MDILKRKEWHLREVAGLEGVTAEFRDLTGKEYRKLSQVEIGDEFKAGGVADILDGSVRAISGLEAGGEAIDSVEKLVNVAQVRVIRAFLRTLILSQYQETDSGN